MRNALCPQCGKPLDLVTQGEYSMLNSEQFDAIKAGDYCCETCPDNGRAKNGKAYFWEDEIPSLRATLPAQAAQSLSADAQQCEDMAESAARYFEAEHQSLIGTKARHHFKLGYLAALTAAKPPATNTEALEEIALRLFDELKPQCNCPKCVSEGVAKIIEALQQVAPTREADRMKIEAEENPG